MNNTLYPRWTGSGLRTPSFFFWPWITSMSQGTASRGLQKHFSMKSVENVPETIPKMYDTMIREDKLKNKRLKMLNKWRRTRCWSAWSGGGACWWWDGYWCVKASKRKKSNQMIANECESWVFYNLNLISYGWYTYYQAACHILTEIKYVVSNQLLVNHTSYTIMERTLQNTYYNPAHPGGLGNVSKLNNAVREYTRVTPSLFRVNTFLLEQDVYTYTPRRPYIFRGI